MKKLFVSIVIAFSTPALAQQVEKLNATLSTPTINTDRRDGYQYEVRGNVFDQNENKIGRYLFRVQYRNGFETIATVAVTLNNRGTLAWQAYYKRELKDDGESLSFVYEGKNLKDGKRILSEYTPSYLTEFGGKLTIFFLNE